MDSFKKVLLPILLVIIFITVAGMFYRKMQELPVAQVIKTVKIGNASIKAEVADSDAERQKGLSGRSALGKDSGMLFVISNGKATPTFWMKDMKFAIDIIWIHSSSGDVKAGKIIQIDKNAEAPKAGTSDSNLNRYSPKSAVDYVLEVNSGYSDSHNIKVGDSLLIE